jgi:serpin B
MSETRVRKGASTAVLATSLYRHLASDRGNLFFSPYSISAALAMIQAGASGATRAEIETAMGHTERGEHLIEAFSELQRVLATRAQSGPWNLSLANALWLQTGYAVNPAFVETLRNRLAAETKNVDFGGAPSDAALAVNVWVDEATHGKIREILSASQLHPLTRMILTNAIYFKAPWSSQFREWATKPEPFQRLDGRSVQVPMMHDTADRCYARGDGFQALEVPYGNDFLLMLLILPDAGQFERVERELDLGSLTELTRNVRPVEVALALPRFRVESSFALREPLARIGIHLAFEPGADFTPVSTEPGFALGDVLHKTVVDVDERGTEAAAVAAAMVLGASLHFDPPKPIEYRVDRPFLFLIEDKPTGTILFIGRILDPSQ